MSIRSGLIVAIRCLILVLLFNTLLSLLTVLGASHQPLAAQVPALIIIALAFVPLLLIFWRADGIVAKLAPKQDVSGPDIGVSTDMLQATAFSAVGAYILYGALRETVSVASLLWRIQPRRVENLDLGLLLGPMAGWVVGLTLLIGAPTLRRWLGRLRRAAPDLQ